MSQPSVNNRRIPTGTTCRLQSGHQIHKTLRIRHCSAGKLRGELRAGSFGAKKGFPRTGKGARRGLLRRHLVLPGLLSGISPGLTDSNYVNLFDRYRPLPQGRRVPSRGCAITARNERRCGVIKIFVPIAQRPGAVSRLLRSAFPLVRAHVFRVGQDPPFERIVDCLPARPLN